jgi:hypothetical protein
MQHDFTRPPTCNSFELLWERKGRFSKEDLGISEESKKLGVGNLLGIFKLGICKVLKCMDKTGGEGGIRTLI